MLTADMHGVLRNFIGLPHRALARGQLDLRRERLLRAGRQHHRPISIHAEFQPAEKACVIVEEAHVGRAGRHNIAGDGGGEKGLAVDQGKIVDLAWLGILVDKARLRIGRNYLYELRLGNNQFCAHATICSTSFTPFCRISV